MENFGYKTKKDIVVEVLREAILSGALRPGERLSQDELAERFNVSSTPVREALRQLQAEGILDHSPHKGVRVVEVKSENVREIALIRAVLEGLATRVAAGQLSAQEVEELKAIQTKMETLGAEGERRVLRKLNYDFHMRIYQAANMPQLYQIIRNFLWTKWPWDTLYVVPVRARMMTDEHRQILRAIERGDPNEAERCMQLHIELGAEVLTRYLAESSVTSDTV